MLTYMLKFLATKVASGFKVGLSDSCNLAAWAFPFLEFGPAFGFRLSVYREKFDSAFEHLEIRDFIERDCMLQ
jgi:hypothetical protein